MKTFETEKGNIPEGATHYSDEQEGSYFCWYIVSGDLAEICVLDGVGFGLKWHRCTNEHKGINVKPIPQAKEVEWVNGDGCNYGGVDAMVVGYCSDSSWIVIEHSGEVESVNVMHISKPETKQQREDRERLEAVEEMFTYWSDDKGDFVAGDEEDRWIKELLVALHDAGYRKVES